MKDINVKKLHFPSFWSLLNPNICCCFILTSHVRFSKTFINPLCSHVLLMIPSISLFRVKAGEQQIRFLTCGSQESKQTHSIKIPHNTVYCQLRHFFDLWCLIFYLFKKNIEGKRHGSSGKYI